MSLDLQNNQTVYKERFPARKESIKPFISALLPLLRDYGISAVNDYAAEAQLQYNNFPDSDGCRDGYSGLGGCQSLRGVGLIHHVTGKNWS